MRIKIKAKSKFISGILLLMLFLLFIAITEVAWYDMVVRIREAITSGDTGHLILASAHNSLLFMIQNAVVFLSLLIGLREVVKRYQISYQIRLFVHLMLFVFINGAVAMWTLVPWEPVTSISAAVLILILVNPFEENEQLFMRTAVLSVQIFFAFQWLNIMPSLTSYRFGITDIPTSIKLVSIYLESTRVMNFVGMAFFIPVIFAAGITAVLFLSFDRNISIAEENFEKQKTLDAIRSKAIENRIYEEIHTLTHDLKTPLVTIRGLNSLMSLSKDVDKIGEYTDRIDGAVGKMSEMISSFLYASSKQILSADELMTYVRAQIPIEDETLEIVVQHEDDLPKIYVNKIRIVRAIINIIENAIVAETRFDHKVIAIKFEGSSEALKIIFEDNGTGIPKDILEHIWEMGFSTNQTSGLGLSFAKKVIEDHDGSIEIESIVNFGTTVTITIPSAEYSNLEVS